MSRAIAITTTALVLFTVLVLVGAMSGIDDWGIDHVMPALNPRQPNSGIVAFASLWRPLKLGIPWWQALLDVFNYPASVLVSGLAVATLALVLARRGRQPAALVWIAAWCVANGAELVGKYAIARPAVYWSNGRERIHVVPYDHSYPSGHTLRAIVLAAVVAYAWPRSRFVAACWLLLVPVTLVVGADHTISDVVGGLILGLLVLLVAHAIIGRWIPSTASSRASSAPYRPIRSPFSRISRDRASSSPTGS